MGMTPTKPLRRDMTAAGVWTLIIYATIPYAQPVLQFLGRNFGGDPNLNIGVVTVVMSAVLVLSYKLIRRPGFGLGRGIWLGAVFGGYVYFMNHMEIPAEKIHFLEYGILSVLIFRAVRHVIANEIVYYLTFAICYLIGVSDEFIQSMVPKRVGDIVDTGWNLAAVLLALIGVSKVWVPANLDRPIRKGHVWIAFAAWAAGILSCAGFIHELSDFGYRIHDPRIGSFNSAFPKDRLAQIDAGWGAAAAAVLDETDDTEYGEFLKKYSSKSDPYLHEARVHLFRRDRYLRKFLDPKTEGSDTEKISMLHIAAMENRILESYFPTLMAHTARHRWRELQTDVEDRLARRQALAPNYESAVGKRMITQFDIPELWASAVILIITFAFGAAWYSRRCSAT